MSLPLKPESLTNSKIKLRRGFKTFAENKAIELRKQLGLGSHEFLCAFKVCEYLKVQISDIKNLGLDEKNINNLLGEGSAFWSAATIPLGNGEYIIVHNTTHSLQRQQSNLMHEIAHVLCAHETVLTENIGGLAGLMRSFNQEQENEAECLGSSLQLPREALLWSLKKNLSISDISERFTASEEMVRFRINITGVRNQLRYTK